MRLRIIIALLAVMSFAACGSTSGAHFFVKTSQNDSHSGRPRVDFNISHEKLKKAVSEAFTDVEIQSQTEFNGSYFIDYWVTLGNSSLDHPNALTLSVCVYNTPMSKGSWWDTQVDTCVNVPFLGTADRFQVEGEELPVIRYTQLPFEDVTKKLRQPLSAALKTALARKKKE